MNLVEKKSVFDWWRKRGWAQILSWLVIGLGLITLFGWIFNINEIIRPVFGLVAMNPTTALLFIVLSVAICFMNCKPVGEASVRYGYIMAAVVGVVALLRLTVIPEIDLYFLKATLEADAERLMAGSAISNRMAPNTSVTFVIASLAIMFLKQEKKFIRGSQRLSTIVALFGILSIVGYELHVPEFYDALARFPMSLSTAVAFVLLSQSILWSQKKSGPIKEFSKDTRVSRRARMLVPFLVLIPLLIGVVVINQYKRGNMSVELGLALFITFCIVIFPIIIWYYVRAENYAAENRKKAAEIRKLLEKTNAQNQRLMGFANTVSHNLRANAVNIQSLLQFVKLDDKPFAQDELFPMLENASSGLKETIDNLFEITKMENKAGEGMVAINVKEVVDRAVSAIGFTSTQAGVSIEVEVDDDLNVLAVPAYLDSIISNLISNAIKYRSKDRAPVVIVHSGVHGERVSLSVEDNGLGMDLNVVGNKLFGMYKTFHGNKDASGIGLFLVKGQVESMNGTIEVESEVDAGTTFTVTLDAAVNAIPTERIKQSA